MQNTTKTKFSTSKNSTENKEFDEEGIIVASKPLTDENWIDIVLGSLMVLRDGKQVYPVIVSLTEQDELQILRALRKSPHKLSLFELINGLFFCYYMSRVNTTQDRKTAVNKI